MVAQSVKQHQNFTIIPYQYENHPPFRFFYFGDLTFFNTCFKIKVDADRTSKQTQWKVRSLKEHGAQAKEMRHKKNKLNLDWRTIIILPTLPKQKITTFEEQILTSKLEPHEGQVYIGEGFMLDTFDVLRFTRELF